MKPLVPVLYISMADDGHMGVSAPGNRKKYFAKLGIKRAEVVDVVPVHGNKIKIVSKNDGGKFFEGFDGIITKDKNLFLGLTAADCMPIAFFDPATSKIGLVHCGWRGLENGVIASMVEKLKTKNEQLLVYIGPHICSKHYPTDLSVGAKKQLLDSGVLKKNITEDLHCTFDDKSLFSYRRNKTKDRNLYLLTLVV